MANWIKWDADIDDIDSIQSGDIVETVTKIPDHSPIFKGVKVPFIKHYGMCVHLNRKPHIIHNIIGRSPTIVPMDEVFADRNIHRVLRTGMSDEDILSKYNELKDKKYRLFKFNCESLMTNICGCSIGFPQQKGWTIGLSLTSLIIIVLLVLLLLKKCS